MEDTVKEMLKMHMDQDEKNLKDISERLGHIEAKLDDLTTFKIEMVSSSKLISLAISAVCGFLSVIASGVVTYVLTERLK